MVLADFGYLVMPDSLLSLGPLAVPLTVFSTVGVLNAVNIVDGLAASLVLIAITALDVIAWFGDDVRNIIILGLLGAVILAFLLLNLRLIGRALVFMGDSGNLFLGFVLEWFLVALSQGEQRLLAPVTALWLFALPLIDTISMMVRRMLLRRSPFLADQEHFHYILTSGRFQPETGACPDAINCAYRRLHRIGRALSQGLGALDVFRLSWSVSTAFPDDHADLAPAMLLERPLLPTDDTTT